MKHKHADLIHAWADGAEIQYKEGNAWFTYEYPDWSDDAYEYRIKPEEKKPVVRWLWAVQHQEKSEWRKPNLFMTDAELKEEYPEIVKKIKLEWSRTEFPE